MYRIPIQGQTNAVLVQLESFALSSDGFDLDRLEGTGWLHGPGLHQPELADVVGG